MPRLKQTAKLPVHQKPLPGQRRGEFGLSSQAKDGLKPTTTITVFRKSSTATASSNIIRALEKRFQLRQIPVDKISHGGAKFEEFPLHIAIEAMAIAPQSHLSAAGEGTGAEAEVAIEACFSRRHPSRAQAMGGPFDMSEYSVTGDVGVAATGGLEATESGRGRRRRVWVS